MEKFRNKKRRKPNKSQTQQQPKPNPRARVPLHFGPARAGLRPLASRPQSASPRCHLDPTPPATQTAHQLAPTLTLSAMPGPRVSALLSPSFPAPQRPPEITGEVAGILIPLRPAAIPARPL